MKESKAAYADGTPVLNKTELQEKILKRVDDQYKNHPGYEPAMQPELKFTSESLPPSLDPMTDEDVLRYAKFKFDTEYEKKFRDGMAKYSTPIFEKDGVAEAFPEVWDLISYMAVATLQKSRTYSMLMRLLIEYPFLAENKTFKELMDLVDKKQLAVKKAV